MDSLLKLKADGHKIFIATGRHRREMAALDIDWSFFDGFVTLNGAVNYDRNFSFISAYPFDSAARDSVVSILIEKRIPLFVFTAERMLANVDNEITRSVLASISLPPPCYELPEEDEEIYQLVFYASREEEPAIMRNFPLCTATRWNEYAFDCVLAGVGKDRGVRDVLRALGRDEEHCIVFGDGDNDASMLAAFEKSVAMGNATERAKQAASFITDDIDDDGVQKALKHFGLI